MNKKEKAREGWKIFIEKINFSEYQQIMEAHFKQLEEQNSIEYRIQLAIDLLRINGYRVEKL